MSVAQFISNCGAIIFTIIALICILAFAVGVACAIKYLIKVYITSKYTKGIFWGSLFITLTAICCGSIAMMK